MAVESGEERTVPEHDDDEEEEEDWPASRELGMSRAANPAHLTSGECDGDHPAVRLAELHHQQHLTSGERDGDHPAVRLAELLYRQHLTSGGRCPCSKHPVTQTTRTVSCTSCPVSSLEEGGG